MHYLKSRKMFLVKLKTDFLSFSNTVILVFLSCFFHLVLGIGSGAVEKQ